MCVKAFASQQKSPHCSVLNGAPYSAIDTSRALYGALGGAQRYTLFFRPKLCVDLCPIPPQLLCRVYIRRLPEKGLDKPIQFMYNYQCIQIFQKIPEIRSQGEDPN